MPAAAHVYFVIPVFNELANLERLFSSFHTVVAQLGDQYAVSLILVDDGSTDGTSEAAPGLGGDLDLTILRNASNEGPGHAFGSGFEYLAPRLTEADWVVTLEGDNTSRHQLLRQMLHRADEGYDVILASPYLYGGGIANTSALRLLTSHLANAFVKQVLGVHGIMTVSSFFRLYRAPIVRRLQERYGPRIVERRGFECMVEVLLKLIYVNATISEVPMLLDTNLRAGKTKMRIRRTVMGYFALLPRLRRWRSSTPDHGRGRYTSSWPAWPTLK